MHTPNSVYYIYIVTNPNKTTLYTGVTNNLPARIVEHWENRNQPETFAGRYFCYNLIYYEAFQYIQTAIAREKEIKKWRREKKDLLIDKTNPKRQFLNKELLGEWPPQNASHRKHL